MVETGSQGWRDTLCFLLCRAARVWLPSLLRFYMVAASSPLEIRTQVPRRAGTLSTEQSPKPHYLPQFGLCSSKGGLGSQQSPEASVASAKGKWEGGALGV